MGGGDAYMQEHLLILSSVCQDIAEILLLLARSSYLFHVFHAEHTHEVEVYLKSKYILCDIIYPNQISPGSPGLHLAGCHQP
jgi:hypothetical protein